MALAKVESSEEDPFQTATAGNKRQFFSFIKTLGSFKGDLSAITAPPFLLSPVSLTEHPMYWAVEPSRFIAPATEPDPAKRMVLVLKWYLNSMMHQFGKRDKRKKKPLNPFLGELFLGRFEDEATGTTELVTEQVSHHPPVTAYRIWNERHSVQLYGYYAQRTYFSGTIRMERIGHMLLRLDNFDEDFVVTLPSAHLEGLIPPPPYPEADGKTKIQSSSGYGVEVDYSGKGWLRGKRNTFAARIYNTSHPGEVLYTAEGQWYGASYVIRNREKTVIETIDTVTSRPLPPLMVAPIEEQDPIESRRAWYTVADAIERGDFAMVHREKSRLEEEQRAMRKAEKIEDREWQMRYFSKHEKWPEAEDLLGRIGMELENERTKGVWRWDPEKYEKASRKAPN